MTNMHKFLICLPLLAAVVACGSSGYYDANGNYVPSAYADDEHNGADGRKYHNATDEQIAPAEPYYDRPGYYDYYGNYVTVTDGAAVPKYMFPPRGLCRVWFPDREIARQPGVESCEGIRARLPVGAYVIYGG